MAPARLPAKTARNGVEESNLGRAASLRSSRDAECDKLARPASLRVR